MNTTHPGTLFLGRCQGFRGSGAAAVDHRLPGVPANLGSYLRNEIINGGDKDKFGGISHTLGFFQNSAVLYRLGKSLRGRQLQVMYGNYPVALLGESYRQGGADGAGADKTYLEHSIAS